MKIYFYLYEQAIFSIVMVLFLLFFRKLYRFPSYCVLCFYSAFALTYKCFLNIYLEGDMYKPERILFDNFRITLLLQFDIRNKVISDQKKILISSSNFFIKCFFFCKMYLTKHIQYKTSYN